jgi:GTP-binding protein
MIPIESDDWQAELDQLRHEIGEHSAELAAKPYCVVFTKLDLLGEHYIPDIVAPGAFGLFAISAPGRIGLDLLLDAWWSELLAMRAVELKPKEDAQLLP